MDHTVEMEPTYLGNGFELCDRGVCGECIPRTRGPVGLGKGREVSKRTADALKTAPSMPKQPNALMTAAQTPTHNVES